MELRTVKFEKMVSELKELYERYYDYYSLKLRLGKEGEKEREKVLNAIKGEPRIVLVWECPFCRFRTESLHGLQLIQRAIEHYFRCKRRKRRVKKKEE